MLSHYRERMSIIGAALAGVAWAASAGSTSASVYAGRWTVDDDKPQFSAKGRLYKNVDVAPCAGDVCGVSVADNGACGPVLFRFHAATLAKGETAKGHGRWGTVKKNLVLDGWRDKDLPGGRRMGINLGDGYDFGERSGNMPKYTASYRPVGKASCVAR